MSHRGAREILTYAQQNHRGPIYLGFEGTIVGGSYDPTDGSVQVVVGEALSLFDNGDQGYAQWGKLMTFAVGEQAGPQGGERALLLPTRGGYRVMIEHDEDDSPQVPVGERWILHPKLGSVGAGNTPVWDGGVKFTNDAAAPGDGLGGTYVGNQGGVTQSQTKSGHQVRLDDINKLIQTVSAGGLIGVFDDQAQQISHVAQNTYTIIDGIADEISHVVSTGGKIGLGDLVGNLGSANQITRFSDLDSALQTQVRKVIGNALLGFVATVAANSGSFGTLSASTLLGILFSGAGLSLTSYLSGVMPGMPSITTPTCSPTVLAK